MVEGFAPTGMPDVERALGHGYPLGAMSIVSGDVGSGKTQAVYRAVYAALESNERVTLVDMESNPRRDFFAGSPGFTGVSPRDPDEAWGFIFNDVRAEKNLVVVDNILSLGESARQLTARIRTLQNILIPRQSAVVFTTQNRRAIGPAPSSPPRAFSYMAGLILNVERSVDGDFSVTVEKDRDSPVLTDHIPVDLFSKIFVQPPRAPKVSAWEHILESR